VTPADLVAKTRSLEPVAPPGREFSYSNADYWLAAMILERATGRTYTHEIAAGILRPLDLRHTVLPHDTTRLRAPYLHGYSHRPGQPPADVRSLSPRPPRSSRASIAPFTASSKPRSAADHAALTSGTAATPSPPAPPTGSAADPRP
jgi:D-alanyl-D-alanine carboxypeptidase